MATKKELADLKATLEGYTNQALSDDMDKWCYYRIFWPNLDDEECEALSVVVTKELAEAMAFFSKITETFKLRNGSELHEWMQQRSNNICRKFDAFVKNMGG